MPLIVRDDFLENNSWLMGDLKCAREQIETIINDLEANDKTHTSYVSEKLEVAIRILTNIDTLCKRNKKEDDSNE